MRGLEQLTFFFKQYNTSRHISQQHIVQDKDSESKYTNHMIIQNMVLQVFFIYVIRTTHIHPIIEVVIQSHTSFSNYT